VPDGSADRGAREHTALLALLVQMYKYGHCTPASQMAPLTEARAKTPLYLLYSYKSANSDTARRVADGAADRGAREDTARTSPHKKGYLVYEYISTT
jgi:hypothetical protein